MAPPPSDGGNNRPDDETDYSGIKKRLDALGDKLEKVTKSDEAEKRSREEDGARGKAMGFALRIATELVAGVFVGGAIGWFLDSWLGTAPILLIVFLLLGIAAALRNSVRAAQRMQSDSDKR